MKINKQWHEKNRMPKNPSISQRILWHTEHQKHCACREIPEMLQKIIKKE